ncbi:MAG TPA: hypothetical protein VIJ82_33045 [Streptosporangiaceae bacterium]
MSARPLALSHSELMTLCVPKTLSVLCDQVIFADQPTDASLFSDAVLVEVN